MQILTTPTAFIFTRYCLFSTFYWFMSTIENLLRKMYIEGIPMSKFCNITLIITFSHTNYIVLPWTVIQDFDERGNFAIKKKSYQKGKKKKKRNYGCNGYCAWLWLWTGNRLLISNDLPTIATTESCAGAFFKQLPAPLPLTIQVVSLHYCLSKFESFRVLDYCPMRMYLKRNNV